jgi:hypothetical protein
LRGRVRFADIFEYHDPPAQAHTLLRVFEGEIVAAACFRTRADDLFVDYLARDARFKAPERVEGASLLLGAIVTLARTLGLDTIRLHCINDPQSLGWYAKFDFVPDGEPFEEPGWGLLHPMIRRLPPLGEH